LSHQTGARWWAFIDDRLDERMRAHYPEDLDMYRADWRVAHGLAQAYSDAVASEDVGRGIRILQQMREFAAGWDGHPDHPDRAAA
jgi:hypothetical protein